MKKTSVRFTTQDQDWKRVFDRGEQMCLNNIMNYDGRKVIVEGGGYLSMWPETQPMAGEMYAKRDLEVAINNQEIFLDYQLPNGRLPGMLHLNTTKDVENQPDSIVVEPVGVTVSYGWLQGCFYPEHAYDMYFLGDQNKAYLQRFYDAFKRYDEYLWSVRDSDGDGCLELWCEWDAGEDNAYRLKGLPHGWGYPYPPEGRGAAPIESMDVMGYSHTTRYYLAKISEQLENGQAEYWYAKAKEVADKVHDYLWIDEKNACFDRDYKNEFMPQLLHNNLRLMYYRVFSQDMADRFVKYHLKNPEEFWTYFPLPCIALNDPDYRVFTGNCWGGPPQGLTYQRAILALENYGYEAEITYLGRKLMQAVTPEGIFSQQFDPNTMEIIGTGLNDYIPTVMAFLEYTSRMYGVNIKPFEIFWGAVESEYDWQYDQIWGDEVYSVKKDGKEACIMYNDKPLLRFSTGFRIVTDRACKPLYAVRIEDSVGELVIDGKTVGSFGPNERYHFKYVMID